MTTSTADTRDRRERTATLLREPEFFEDLIDEISGGKTLLEFCEEKNVLYGRVYRWIASDESRSELVDIAEQARAKNLTDRVIRGIVTVDDVTVKDVLTDSGEVKATSDLSASAARAVQSIEVSTDQTGTVTKKVKLNDRLKALEMAGRNQKMFTDKVEHNGQIGLADLVTASMQPKDKADAA
jgi:hypothetical protein